MKSINPYLGQSTSMQTSTLKTPRWHWASMLGIWMLVFVAVWTLFRPDGRPPLHNPSAQPRAVTPRDDLTAQERSTIKVFREASPSVVYITTSDLGRDFLGLNVFEIPRGTGSGFIYDRDGHIVTNFHVIREGQRWRVRLADGSEWDADIVGYERDKDLAVLKIGAPREKLKPITLGSSSDLQVGQKVLAIGNPFGFDQTLTVGIVSALGREISAITGRKIHGVIQTDAAINPGNSGGPLLDSAGRLIGVNTQIASPSGASAGIGFAVPVDIVNDIVPDLIRYGKVRRPVLGVRIVDDRVTSRLLGIRGVLIDSVTEGSGAARVGLRGTLVNGRGYIRQLGDIIIKLGDTEVGTNNELRDALEAYQPGDGVRVTYVRDDRASVVTVQLDFLD